MYTQVNKQKKVDKTISENSLCPQKLNVDHRVSAAGPLLGEYCTGGNNKIKKSPTRNIAKSIRSRENKVIQLEKECLSETDKESYLALGKFKSNFQHYVMWEKEYVFDSKSWTFNSGDDNKKFSAVLDEYKNLNKTELDSYIREKEIKELKIISLAEKAIKERFNPSTISTITQHGKNNLAIFDVKLDDKEEKIIKLFRENYKEARVIEIGSRNKEIDCSLQSNYGGIEVSIQKEYLKKNSGEITVLMAVYDKAKGVNDLETAMKFKHPSRENIHMLGEQIGNFHFRLQIAGKENTDKYLIHDDLNPSNIIVLEGGGFELIDTEGMKISSDFKLVKNDISVLLSSIKGTVCGVDKSDLSKKIATVLMKDFFGGYRKSLEKGKIGNAESIINELENYCK